jgi:hypothetical protein
MLRYALIDHVIVHRAQLLADPGLHLPTEAGFGLSGARHGFLMFRFLSRGLYRLNVGLAVLHFRLPPFTRSCRPPLVTTTCLTLIAR